MIDKDLVDALTGDLVAALSRQRMAERMERRANWALAEAEEALEAEPDDRRHPLTRDRAEEAWREAQARFEAARRAREVIEAELEAMDPAAVRGAYLRHGRSGAAGDR